MRFVNLLAVALVASTCSATASSAAALTSGLPAQAPRGTSSKPDTIAPSTARVNSNAALLEDFEARSQRYLEIRKQAAKDAPKLKETSDPAKIKAAQDSLAARIRALRADAKPGDIFTPEIRTLFRGLLAPALKGEDGRDTKEVLKDDAPAAVPLKVNARYPEGAPLPTMPASLLINLPPLPERLEYRIVGKHMILLDPEADIVVDFIPNAIK